MLGGKVCREVVAGTARFTLSGSKVVEVVLEEIVEALDGCSAGDEIDPGVMGGRDHIDLVIAGESVEDRACSGDVLGCRDTQTDESRGDADGGLAAGQECVAHAGGEGVGGVPWRAMADVFELLGQVDALVEGHVGIRRRTESGGSKPGQSAEDLVETGVTGVLSLILPVAEKAKPRRITLESADEPVVIEA